MDVNSYWGKYPNKEVKRLQTFNPDITQTTKLQGTTKLLTDDDNIIQNTISIDYIKQRTPLETQYTVLGVFQGFDKSHHKRGCIKDTLHDKHSSEVWNMLEE